MFVPKTAAASRNPRRRPRTSDESVKPPRAKRQRSVLRQAGDSHATSLNHDQREVAEPSIIVPAADYEVATTPIGTESRLPIRGPKQAEGPSHDAEGTVVLVRTLELPPFASQLRGQSWDVQNFVMLMPTEYSQAPITTPWSSFQLYRIKSEAPFPVSHSSARA